MAEACCSQPDLREGHCAACGFCSHEVILNGACMACGEEDLAVTIRPDAPSDLVPLTKRSKE